MAQQPQISHLGMPHTTMASEKKQIAKEKLMQAVGDSRDVIARATTVFPFTLFPDTITIDRNKVSVTHRTFFNVAEVQSFRIEDIFNVTVQLGPFFGGIQLATQFYDAEKPYTVNMFWRSDALRIKRIIQGYMIALKKKVDTSALSSKELAKALDDLGKVGEAEKV